MNEVQASKVEMMLAAGRKRLERKAARDTEAEKLSQVERVLGEWISLNGPLTHETPRHILELARVVAHRRVVIGERDERLDRRRRHVRMLDIWGAVRAADDKEKADRLAHQEDRLAALKARPRVRGVGAAARRAGY